MVSSYIGFLLLPVMFLKNRGASCVYSNIGCYASSDLPIDMVAYVDMLFVLVLAQWLTEGEF